MAVMGVGSKVQTADIQLVTFEVAGRLYGLDIRVTKEINPNVSITSIPRTPPHLRGLVNIRGQVVLVIDIATTLGRGRQQLSDDSQVVILKTDGEIRHVPGLADAVDPTPFGDKPLGLLVDRIGDVIAVPAAQFEAVPPHLSNEDSRHLSGVVHLGDSLLVIVNAEEMLRTVNRCTAESPSPRTNEGA